MRSAVFQVSGELLRKVLNMPPNSRFIGANLSRFDEVEFTVDDPALPEAGEPHKANPTVTAHYVEWHWNVKEPGGFDASGDPKPVTGAGPG